MCAHAKFFIFGRTEGIWRVPMRNVFLLAELKALGVCLSTRQELSHHRSCGARAGLPGPCGLGQRANKGVRALRNRALHLLRYCAALAWPGPQATAPEGTGPGI